jgi:hypothetical protein
MSSVGQFMKYGKRIQSSHLTRDEAHVKMYELEQQLTSAQNKIEELEKENVIAQKLIGYDLYSNRKKRGAPLWSDKHPFTIDCTSNEYNLHEDILCLKEDIVEQKETIATLLEALEDTITYIDNDHEHTIDKYRALISEIKSKQEQRRN